jgi:FkbH-like protein
MNITSAKSLSCALLSSFTLDPVAGLVSARLESLGLRCQWFISPFNQYPQLILADNSELAAANPQVVFLAVAIEDLLDQLPSLWANARQRKPEAERRIADFLSLLRKLAERLPSAMIFVHDFLPLAPQGLPILAGQSGMGLRQLALEANLSLEKLVCRFPNVRVVSLSEAFRALPHTALCDPRFYYVAKMRLGREALEALAEQYCRLLRAFAGLRKKCIVLDLDNTLWGGILGEDGPDDLQLSDDGPGKAFQDMQRVLLSCYETGILLAVCSKNDESLATSVIREHPGMVLRPNHFAAMRINWQSKAINLREIAAELNLGLDSFVFLDDSELERAEVQRLVPSVTTPDLPADPSDYPAFVAQLPYFDALGTTEDDRRRGQMYVEDRERRTLARTSESLEDFLRGLNIQVVVRRSDRQLVPRLAQLSQRTNQFNLTTRRYTETDLLALLENQNWRLYGLLASDRIGDSGISGAAFVQVDSAAATARLDTFLVSCRVLGRGIESAFLAGICSDLQAGGLATLVAEYVPSEKNGMARDFLRNHDFQSIEPGWRRPLENGQAGCPPWIQLKLS